MTRSPDFSLSRELIEGGGELAGATAGAALGLCGGPVGVFAGAGAGVVVARALKRVGAELQERLLGPRQKVRVGAAFAFAVEEIRRRLDAGERPAHAVWNGSKQRGEPEELLEGVLLTAGESWEERKVRHLGLLYAFLIFQPYDIALGHYLIQLARRLTYRQYQCLALVGDPHFQKAGGLLFDCYDGSANTTLSTMVSRLR
jgi:hypothetical protein